LIRMRTRWFPIAALFLALALVAAACGGDDDEGGDETTTTTTAAETTTTTTSGDGETTTTTEGGMEVAFDKGVTDEPCPDAVNPDNGCIYLGVISDLTVGPFAPVAQPLTQGNRDFWQKVNEAGGVGGMFDVAITNDTTADAQYNAEMTVEGFVRIEPNILALAQSLGTPQTQAALDRYEAADIVAVPATWWSGWSFADFDKGLILESTAPYCIEAQNGFDFMAQARGGEFTYGIVSFPGDYGADYAAGVKAAAAANGFGDPLFEELQIPLSAGGDVAAAVQAVVANAPDVVFLTSGPSELAQILAGAFGAGWQGAVVGAGPTWNPGLLGQNEQLDQILQAAYFQTSPAPNWDADTPGHAAMRAAAEVSGIPPNPGYLAGWAFQYPLLALLEKAVASGDLTRANLVALANTLEDVDYEDMVPAHSFVGSPNDFIERGNVVNRVDPNGSDGTSTAAPFFTGPSASAFEMNEPCFTG
jgi:ABC-type branched-subunit amino acid transport system substrate-binding protein